MPRYIHPHSLVPREWLYHAMIYQPPLSSSMGVIISCHDTSTPTLKFHGSDYVVPRYIHPHSQVPWEWLCRATIYPPPLSSSMGLEVIYYATVCKLLCLVVSQDHDLDIFSLLTIFGEGVIISWKYILTPNNIWGGSNYIMTLFLHFSQY